MKYFFFNDLFLLAKPESLENMANDHQFYKSYLLSKDTMLVDDQIALSASILFGKEKLSIKFYENEYCVSFKNRLREICSNLSFNQDNSTREDILKKVKFSGYLDYKRSIQNKNENKFAEIFLKLKGDTIFFYVNKDSSLPKFIIGMKGITIHFAEDKVKKENVIEFTNEKNGHIIYLHSFNQDTLFQWLKVLSFTSAKIENKVKQNYMKENSNQIHFKIFCE
jgi:hypothetical protein